MDIVLNFVQILVLILQFAIIGRAVLSWFPIDPRSPLVSVLNEITEPILAPLRRIVPRIGMIDITPIVAIILMNVIETVLRQTLTR